MRRIQLKLLLLLSTLLMCCAWSEEEKLLLPTAEEMKAAHAKMLGENQLQLRMQPEARALDMSNTMYHWARTYSLHSDPGDVAVNLIELINQAIQCGAMDRAVYSLERMTTLLAGDWTKQKIASAQRGLDAVKADKIKLSRVQCTHAEHLAAAEAVLKLCEKPDDPKANGIVGKFILFKQQNFSGAVSALSRSDDPALKALGLKELLENKSAADQAELGDMWWDIAEKNKSDVTFWKKLVAQSRMWYAMPLPSLATLTPAAKDRLEKRVAIEINKTATYKLSSEDPNFKPRPEFLNLPGNQRPPYDDCSFKTKEENEPYVIIDLGAVKRISGFMVLDRTDQKSFVKKPLVSISDKPQGPWTEIWSSLYGGMFMDSTFQKEPKGRYFRISGRVKQAISLRSIQIFGY